MDLAYLIQAGHTFAGNEDVVSAETGSLNRLARLGLCPVALSRIEMQDARLQDGPSKISSLLPHLAETSRTIAFVSVTFPPSR
jgi:hypothetical protein